MMKLGDNALMKFRKTRQTAFWNYYKYLRYLTNRTVEKEKKAYLEFKVGTNKKHMWKELENMNIHSKKKQSSEIPANLQDSNSFNPYFIDRLSGTDILIICSRC